MYYREKDSNVKTWQEEENRLSNGVGAVTDNNGKQTTAYIVEKRYKVQDYFWGVFWGNGDYKMQETMTLGDKLIFSPDEYKMGVDDLRVLSAIERMVSIGNFFDYKQKILADALKISESRVSRSIKKLVSYGVLYPLKEYERTGFYLNASICYRGELRTGAELMKMPLKEQVELSLQQAKGIYTGRKKKNKNAHQGE